MEDLQVKVWRLNRFSHTPVELVAVFNSEELAKSFIDYQASLCERYGIVKNGVVIYGEED